MSLYGPCFSATGQSDDVPSEELVHTLMGVDLGDLRQVADCWPNVDLTDETVHQAVWGVLGNITGYLHGRMSQWPRWITFSVEYVTETAEKFRALYLMCHTEAMPDLLAHQQQYPGKWQPKAGPDGKASFWLPIWVQVERQPDLGLDDLGNWVVPTGDGLIPAQLRSVLLLPLLHLERDAFEKQLSARLEALKLPVLPLVGTPGFSGVLRVASDRRSVAFWHC